MTAAKRIATTLAVIGALVALALLSVWFGGVS